jgi:aspartate aminotransferase
VAKHPVFADRTVNVPESATMKLAARVRELRAQGKDMISFAAGEPHFEPPAFLYDAVRFTLESKLQSKFSKYTPVPGLLEVRETVAAWVQKTYGCRFSADQILVTNGAKSALHFLFQAFLNEGDEVIYPGPYWVSYPAMVHISGGKSVILNTSSNTHYKVTPEQLDRAMTPRTKLFLFNSPSNPTGVAYSQMEINQLAHVLAKHPQVWVISDDIYDHILWDLNTRAHFSFSDFPKERLLMVQSLSKSHAVTGWRIGFMAVASEVFQRVNLLMGHCQSAVPTFSQWVLKAAFEHDFDFLIPWVAYYRNNMQKALPILRKEWGVELAQPDGAFYLFPRVDSLYAHLSKQWKVPVANDEDFCDTVLAKLRVGFVPGSAFGSPDHVRITTAMSSESFLEGLLRVAEALR